MHQKQSFNSFKISNLEEKYQKSLYALIKSYSDEYIMLPKSQDEIANLAPLFKVIIENDQVIACALLDIFTENLAEVKSLAVNKAHQKKGLGRQLVEACEKEAKAKGISKIFALTFEEKFFNKLGYTTVTMDSLPEKVYRECIRCHFYNDCKEIAVLKEL